MQTHSATGRDRPVHRLKGSYNTMITKTWRLLALVLAFGLVAAACGSDSDTTATEAETESTEAAEEAAEEPAEEEAEEEEAAEEPAEEEAEEEAMAENPYDGETLEILIPFSEGGGTDTWGRALAPFMEQYLADDVSVVAFNDGGKTAAVSSYEKATDHDGLTVFVSSGSISIPFLLDQEGVEYDYADFVGIIGSPVGGVVYASADTGIADVAGLCAFDGDLFMGTKSLSGLDAVPALGLNLLGVEPKVLDGLEGAGPIRAQFEAGDFNLSYDTSGAKEAADALFADGLAVPLFTFGITQADGSLAADSAWPDLPTMADAYETCNGEAPAGEAWDAFLAINTAGFAAQKNVWVHADAPAERIAALQAAAEQIVVDAEFTALAADLIGDYDFVAGADLDAQFQSASQLPPEAKAYLCDFLQTTYEIGGICGG